MIERFNDHAANERTYLAWVRTAIAIMAFGFLIEKFSLFLRYFSSMMEVKNVKFHRELSISPDIVGWILMLAAVVMILVATIRFFTYRKAISKQEKVKYGAVLPNILLSVMMLSVATFIVVYVAREMIIDLS
jgi:putative membrane protein